MLIHFDPHVHGSASTCSQIDDSEIIRAYRSSPEWVCSVSDHMALTFYDRVAREGSGWAGSRGQRAGIPGERLVYGVEVSVAAKETDLVLMTDSRDAFAPITEFLDWGLFSFEPDRPELLQVMRDQQVLVTYAHPRPWAAVPDYLHGYPLDFLEYNGLRMSYAVMRGGMDGVRELDEWLQELRQRHFPEARFIVGSDSHSVDSLKSAFTTLVGRIGEQSGVRTGSEYLAELRAGRYEGLVTLATGRGWTRGRGGGSGQTTVRVLPEDGLTEVAL